MFAVPFIRNTIRAEQAKSIAVLQKQIQEDDKQVAPLEVHTALPVEGVSQEHLLAMMKELRGSEVSFNAGRCSWS
jgi:hypothetical protein